MKNKKGLVLILLIIIAVIGLCIFLKPSKETKKVGKAVNKTEIGKETSSYKMDLRIFGTYNKKRVNKIIMVQNYKNTDKQITINSISDSKEERIEYLVKDSKYYELKDNKTKEVDSVKYENTDIYLSGVTSAKDLKRTDDQSIGDTKYSVYKGKVSSDVMNKILKETDLDYTVSTDTDIEVWYNKDGYIYKVYYRNNGLTVYASFFGYNNMKEIDLSIYK